MTGYFAIFHSLRKNRAQTTMPKTIRQITVGDFQEYCTPPNSRPSRNMTVPPTIVIEPSQSMALRPARIGVFGVSISRKKKIMIKASPSQGTVRSFRLE